MAYVFGDDTFAKALDKKYSILQQTANTDQFNADTTRMGVPIDRMNAMTSRFDADTRRGLMPSQIAQNFASSRNLDASARNSIADAVGQEQMNTMPAEEIAALEAARNGVDMSYAPGGMNDPLKQKGFIGGALSNSTAMRLAENDPRRYAKGTARVPGQGSGKVDTVPAKLAPGEAVLNKAAADQMGRGLIAALNQMGARRMGLV